MNLITQLIDATTLREVDRIVENNIFLIPGNQRAKLSQYANNAKRRIYRIEREKKESYKNILN